MIGEARWNRRTKAELVKGLNFTEQCLWHSLVNAIEYHDCHARDNGAFCGLAEEYWTEASAWVGALFYLTQEPHVSIWDRALREVRTVQCERPARS